MRIQRSHQVIKAILLYRYILTLAYFYRNSCQEEEEVNKKTASGVLGQETGINSSDSSNPDVDCIREKQEISVGFVSEYSDSMNLYQGMNTNPYNFVDPMGEYVRVKIDKKTADITLEIPIEFKGDQATPVNVARVLAGINKYWNGKFGEFNVTANARVANKKDRKSKRNIYYMLKPYTDYEGLPEWLENHRSSSLTAKRNSAAILGGNEGVLYTPEPDNQPEYTAAHETGHLMGLIDRYEESEVLINGIKERVTKPMPGYEGNIMAETTGVVDRRNIKEVLKENKKYKKWLKVRKKVNKRTAANLVKDITRLVFGDR